MNFFKDMDVRPLLLVPALMSRLRAAQGSGETAYVRAGSRAIVSASPELFLLRRGDRVVTRPMKGTARRGRWPAEDEAVDGDKFVEDFEKKYKTDFYYLRIRTAVQMFAEAAKRAKDADMDGCVLKLVQPAHLLEVIERLVPEQAVEAPPAPERAACALPAFSCDCLFDCPLALAAFSCFSYFSNALLTSRRFCS